MNMSYSHLKLDVRPALLVHIVWVARRYHRVVIVVVIVPATLPMPMAFHVQLAPTVWPTPHNLNHVVLDTLVHSFNRRVWQHARHVRQASIAVSQSTRHQPVIVRKASTVLWQAPHQLVLGHVLTIPTVQLAAPHH